MWETPHEMCQKDILKQIWHASSADSYLEKTRRRMVRERTGAGSSVVSIETLYYNKYIKDLK